MDRIIIRRSPRCNPHDDAQIRALFKGNDTYAFWDTLGIFMEYPPEPVLKTIVALQRGGGSVQLKPMIYTDPEGKECIAGATTIIQRPNEKTFDYLSYISSKVPLIISMADLAWDVICTDDKTRSEITQLIRNQMLLRNRRQGLMRQEEFTLGWNNQSNKGRHIPKNLVLYDDQPSKETGEDCVHLELRLRKAALLRRNGIETIEDLRTVNPHDLFNRNVRLTAFSQEDKEGYVNRAIRNSYRKNFYRPKDKRQAAFAERYNAGLLKKLKHLASKGMHAGQVLHVALKRNRQFNRSIDIKSLNIPRVLTIPRVISSPIEIIAKTKAMDACDDMDMQPIKRRRRVRLEVNHRSMR